MNKKRLAFIIPSLKAGGAERVVSTLANELIKDFDVLIIVLYKCDPFYKLDNAIRVEFCKTYYNKNLSTFQSIQNHYKLILKILKFVKHYKPNLLIGFMTTANVYAIIVSKIKKVPSIISERVHPEYSEISGFWFKVRRLLYPKTNKLIVQTKDIKSYFKSFVSERKMEIIKNPLAQELIELRDLTVTKSNLIINVGRLDDQKNQDVLIKAFSNVKQENWKLQIVGEGKKRAEYTELINSLGLQEDVMLVGNVSNVSDYYNKASVFAFTSKFEGFPNALTEAMYFGLACISTDCPSGPSELIVDSENGFLIPVGDQKQLEKKLALLINDSNLRAQLGKNALNSTKHLEANNITLQWRNVITNVVQ